MMGEYIQKNGGFGSYIMERDALRAAMFATYESIRYDEAEQAFVEAIPKKHVKSAKERVTGVDESPLIHGNIQMTKLQQKGTNNLETLRDEWAGRFREKYCQGGAISQEERYVINNTKITTLKALIMADEEQRTGDEYKEHFFKPRFTAYDLYEWDVVKKKSNR